MKQVVEMARFLIEELGVDPHAHCEPPSHFNGQLRREDGSTQSAFTLSTLEQKAPNGQRNQLPGQSELFTLIARLDAKRVAAAEPDVMALVEVPVGPYTITMAVMAKDECHGPDRQQVEQVLANALMNQTPGEEALHVVYTRAEVAAPAAVSSTVEDSVAMEDVSGEHGDVGGDSRRRRRLVAVAAAEAMNRRELESHLAAAGVDYSDAIDKCELEELYVALSG